MSNLPDRLYQLLPAMYRIHDAEQGYPLRDLLRIIAEQVDIVEADITQLYENWFIETCQDWVVPYIGDLIGYQNLYSASHQGNLSTPEELQRRKILIPRRDVANTIRNRRRKGTLALVESLVYQITGWSAKIVEFYKLLSRTENLNHFYLPNHKTVDLGQVGILEKLNTAFEELAHTVNISSLLSSDEFGRYNIPSVGVFIWRLKTYSVTQTPAYCLEEVASNFYTFSVIGNDISLYTLSQPEASLTQVTEEINLPVPLQRRMLEADKSNYYDSDPNIENLIKSLTIWKGDGLQRRPVLPDKIIVADLSDWKYQPPQDHIAVDPELGRMVFPARQLPKHGVWVSYHYAFSADMGGGEYDRLLLDASQDCVHYEVNQSSGECYQSIAQAILQWQQEKPRNAIIEITDSGVYVERINIELENNQKLQLRAANRKRPVIRILDWRTSFGDALNVIVKSGSCFVIDGLLVTGRGIHIESEFSQSENSLPTQKPAKIIVRHCTLVPGWSLNCDCEPRRSTEPSLELFNLKACISISHSIVGSIFVNQDEIRTDPLPIEINDSIIDATSFENEAISAVGYSVAHARLSIIRCTVFGQIQVQAIELAENSIFNGKIFVARRQQGCIRFCYIPPDSSTPYRYHCQPDLIEESVVQEADQQRECDRLQPQFSSTRYGTPTYCQLAETCPVEIKRGADDESEMGVFHDLYQPQKESNLRIRLDEYTPAGVELGIIYVN